jgi:hypothetical protein
MSLCKRSLLFALVAGTALGLAGFQLRAQPAAAQSYYPAGMTGMNCPTGPGPSCSVTLGSTVSAGSSVSVMLPGGTTVTISCPTGCPAGSQFTIMTSSAGYATPTAYAAPQVAFVPVPVVTSAASVMPFGSCFNFCNFNRGCFFNSCMNRFNCFFSCFNNGFRFDPDRRMDQQCFQMMHMHNC